MPDIPKIAESVKEHLSKVGREMVLHSEVAKLERKAEGFTDGHPLP